MGNKKHLNYFDVEKNLQIAINNGKIIRLVSYFMSADIEEKMDRIIESLLAKYGKEDYKGLVYTAVKELAINATKANLKRVFFEERGLDINKPDEYEQGMVLYKDYMTEEMAVKYGKKAKKKGLFVRISFFHTPQGLRIEVINNTNITPQEEQRLREKLGKIMQYDSLVDFYMNNPDNTEGAGMGLALVTTLMKGENIDPNLFRIMTCPEETVARIEIPFSSDFVSIRDMGKKARKTDEEEYEEQE